MKESPRLLAMTVTFGVLFLLLLALLLLRVPLASLLAAVLSLNPS